MIIGIDASNIRGGGGLTHLVELLGVAHPSAHGFSQIIVWSGSATLHLLEDRPWLVKCHQPLLDCGMPLRIFWQTFRLSQWARAAHCDVLLVPGGSYAGNFRPAVVMSRNMLPFEWRELRRFGWSWMTIKLLLLRAAQTRSFRRADGLIFLTRFARDVVMGVMGTTAAQQAIIPHGVDERFIAPPRAQLSVSQFAPERPCRIVYVSSIFAYKHQWQVAKAVAQLRAQGLPVTLEFIGPAHPPALQKLQRTLIALDPDQKYLRYIGAVPYDQLHTRYAQADVCVFASSCENMPNILLEGMACGLPVACSNRGPMPEILGDAGVYFDPENAQDIARAVQELFDAPLLRSRLAHAAFVRARQYSWQRCARETFHFLTEIAQGSQHIVAAPLSRTMAQKGAHIS